MILRKLLSLSLSLVIAFPGHSRTQISDDKDPVSGILKRISQAKSMNEIVNMVKEKTPSKVDEVVTFLKSNNLEASEIPQLKLYGRTLVFNEEQNIKITVSENNQVIVRWGDKEKQMLQTMSMKEVMDEVKNLSPTKQFSLLDLFISNAYANDDLKFVGLVALITSLALLITALPFAAPLAVVGGVALGAGTALGIRESNQVAHALALLEICRTSQGLTAEELAESYNQVAGVHTRMRCTLETRDPEKAGVCAALRQAIRCFRGKLEEARLSNNGARSSGKEIIFNSEQNRYRVTPASPQ